MVKNNFFKDVTLLITHYNRSQSLKRLLDAFQQLNCSFEEIVVSDDGSKAEHLEQLYQYRDQYGFRLVTTPENRGLGNNLNKGQDAVNTPYTLYIQEDFVPKAIFPAKLSFALQYLTDHPDTDIARFYAYFKYPYLKPVGEGFAEMLFTLLSTGYRKFYMYSDHPHLRRSGFFSKFGRYPEGISGDKTEYKMMMSFLRNRGKAIYYEDFKSLFDQVNSSAEPSTIDRHSLRTNDNKIVSVVRAVYRHIKFNLDFIFTPNAR